jgi:hypothetical protein
MSTSNELAVIGAAGDGYTCHYYDSRGVSRVFDLRVEDRTWSFLRQAPDFHQRFTWEFSPDGRRMDMRIEASHDEGRSWEHDFDMAFSKV